MGEQFAHLADAEFPGLIHLNVWTVSYQQLVVVSVPPELTEVRAPFESTVN